MEGCVLVMPLDDEMRCRHRASEGDATPERGNVVMAMDRFQRKPFSLPNPSPSSPLSHLSRLASWLIGLAGETMTTPVSVVLSRRADFPRNKGWEMATRNSHRNWDKKVYGAPIVYEKKEKGVGKATCLIIIEGTHELGANGIFPQNGTVYMNGIMALTAGHPSIAISRPFHCSTILQSNL